MPRAGRDLNQIFAFVDAARSRPALRWFLGLQEAIESLTTNPQRGTITTEDRSVRHLLYGRKPHLYRILYLIRDEQQRVDIIHVRHGARQAF